MDKVIRLINAIKKMIEGEFSGYIKINFTQGNIGRVEKFEEFDDASVISTKPEQITKEEKDYL